MRVILLGIIMLVQGILLPMQALAQIPPPPPMVPSPNPPTLPHPVTSGEALEPEVTIIQRPEAQVQEYRSKGQLYMVKITPNRGRPYYLIDHNGDGSLETRTFELEMPQTPQWVLFRW